MILEILIFPTKNFKSKKSKISRALGEKTNSRMKEFDTTKNAPNYPKN